jgi:hypothetical protein
MRGKRRFKDLSKDLTYPELRFLNVQRLRHVSQIQDQSVQAMHTKLEIMILDSPLTAAAAGAVGTFLGCLG